MAGGFDWKTRILLPDSDAEASTSTSISASPQQPNDNAQGRPIEKISGKKIARVREALRVPEDTLDGEHVKMQYPDWPTTKSAKDVWGTVLRVLKEVVNKYAEDVMINGRVHKWGANNSYDFNSQDYDLQVDAIAEAYAALSKEEDIVFIVERLKRCEENWALKILLTTRGDALKRRKKKGSEGPATVVLGLLDFASIG
ncbi:hypothetical protein TWF481_002683 [Arthrobotrys musiformis]|uniref:Uncharacterized protein n=1 Tax=Arthrobotrys musiformis TaxID=47236 RepID=A0AAV9VQX0_9PEZI